MNRLIFVNGPWQLMLAASALRQASQSIKGRTRDTLVMYSLPDGAFPQPLREVMEKIAPVVWPWERVVLLDNAIDWWTPGDTQAAVKTLQGRLNEPDPDQLWLNDVPNTPAKISAEAYPTARIVLYEDGLHSYLPRQDHRLSVSRCLTEPRRALRTVRMRIRERLHPDDLEICPLLARHRARIEASYLWVSLVVPPSDYQKSLPWIQLQTRFMKETIALVSPIVDHVDLEGGGKRQAVLMGQCFSNYGDLRRDVELGCYVNLARRLQAMDFKVLWKEHPRTRQPFRDELIVAAPGVRTLPDLGPWPIELFVERLGVGACAGLSSTSLFSIPLLFNLPAFSPVGRYVSLFSFPNDGLARLVANAIEHVGSDAA
jgi:Alpha-2,8-polysialyltransferase (POLYST)